MTDSTIKTAKAIGIGVLPLAAVTGYYILIAQNKTADTEAATTSESQTSTSSAPTSSLSDATSTSETGTVANTTSGLTAGTYVASTSYSVPHGYSNTIAVTATIDANGTITAVSTQNSTDDRESEMYISDFESEVQGEVIQQNIETFSAYRIGGASLTTSAFEDALSEIISQAS